MSLDCVRAGCGVLFIIGASDFPFFNTGDADNSCSPFSTPLLLHLLRTELLVDNGEPDMDGGVTINSSGEDNEQSALKFVGLGAGLQPLTPTAFRSRIGPSKPPVPLGHRQRWFGSATGSRASSWPASQGGNTGVGGGLEDVGAVLKQSRGLPADKVRHDSVQ